MVQYYCPDCFGIVDPGAVHCLHCGVDLRSARERPYAERLIQALRHPLSEVRMGSILSLGNRREIRAAVPLARCALAHPTDLVQALEIVRSLQKLPAGRERDEAFRLLATHPARSIRQRIGNLGAGR